MKFSVKIFIGLVFLLSAILKLVSIDDFEVYVFSLNLLPLNLSFVSSRLLIGLEILLGLLLILNIYKSTVYSALIILILFTVFLIVQLFLGVNENCHCFGTLLKFNTIESIVKNLFLLAGLFYVKSHKVFNLRFKRIIASSILIFSFTLPIIISPPDFIYFKEYDSYIQLNEKDLNEFINNSNISKTEKKTICFFSSKCKYCILAAKKITAIFKNNNIDLNKLTYVFPSEEGVAIFLDDTKSKEVNYIIISPKELLTITNGMLPYIVIHDSLNTKAFMYRSIDESVFVEFFQ